MRKKILWISQLILTVLLAVYALLSARFFYDMLTEQTEKNMKTYVGLYDETAYSLDEKGAVAFASRLSGCRVTFLDVEGNVLGDSERENLGNHADREEVKEALAAGEGYSVRHSLSLGKDMIYYCRFFDGTQGETDGETGDASASETHANGYLVRLAVSGASEWKVFAGTLPTLAWFLLFDFLVCLLCTYAGTEYVISPVRKLAKDAALNLPIETKYPELRPVVDLLNNRNREVSEQLRMLSEEKELVEKAQRSKNDFIANITHEMNTPLTSIRGYSELLASGALNAEQTATAAATLVKQSDRLSGLIAQIINYNEIDNDELPSYEVNISRLAQEILDGLAPGIAARNLTLTADIEENVTVSSRHERLNEVLGNLIRNAIRYNKEGGSLFVSIRRIAGEKEKNDGGRVETNVVRVTVSDTGIGIAEENLERIFERFFTVDKSHSGRGGGFGLGLAVVKKICRRSGWTLDVQSKLGEGTTFTVDIR